MLEFNPDKLDISVISACVKSGDLSTLSPEYRTYYDMMDKVRGLSARGKFNGKTVTRAAVIGLLRQEYGLSDHSARKIYTDSVNFFYTDSGISAEAWANVYADKMDNTAILARENGNLELALKCTVEAAKLRRCYEPQQPEIPEEMFRKPTVIYTLNPEDIGRTPVDKKELTAFIDKLPDIPTVVRDRVKSHAGLIPFSIEDTIDTDTDEFTEDN